MKIFVLLGILTATDLTAAATCEPILVQFNQKYDPLMQLLPFNYRKTHYDGEQYTFGFADPEFSRCLVLQIIPNEYATFHTPHIWLECAGEQSAVRMDPGEGWLNDGKWRSEFNITCGSDGRWHLDSPLAPGAADTIMEMHCIDPIPYGFTWSGWEAGCALMPPTKPARPPATSCPPIPLGRRGYLETSEYAPSRFYAVVLQQQPDVLATFPFNNVTESSSRPFNLAYASYAVGESFELSFNGTDDWRCFDWPLHECNTLWFLRGFRGQFGYDIESMAFDGDGFYCWSDYEAHWYHNGDNSECCEWAELGVYPYVPLKFHGRFTLTCEADGEWHIDKKLMIGDVVDAVLCDPIPNKGKCAKAGYDE